MMLVDMRTILNEEQWNKLRNLLEEREERGHRGPRGMGGPPPGRRP
jgi:hypothetical protein